MHGEPLIHSQRPRILGPQVVRRTVDVAERAVGAQMLGATYDVRRLGCPFVGKEKRNWGGGARKYGVVEGVRLV